MMSKTKNILLFIIRSAYVCFGLRPEIKFGCFNSFTRLCFKVIPFTVQFHFIGIGDSSNLINRLNLTIYSF